MERLLMGDFRQALRSLRSRPGFLVTAVLTLALGIGANTAVFSAVLAVLLRPLPFPDSDRLAVLWMKTPDGEKRPISVRAFQMWREQNRSFEQMALLAGWFFTVKNGDSVEQVLGGRVSANLFPLLGAQPLHGRLFLAGEDDASAPRVAVLSHSLWQRRFAGDRSVLGQPISMNGEVYTVVGVLPPGFTIFAVPMEVWVPLVSDKGFGLDHHRSVAVARLRSGAGIAQAEADMTRVAARFGEVIPSLRRWGVIVTTLHEELTGKVEAGLWTLQGAVVLVLL
ncbi:MAG: ABC transporter permease, partial [Bryobacteraceae bacterium]